MTDCAATSRQRCCRSHHLFLSRLLIAPKKPASLERDATKPATIGRGADVDACAWCALSHRTCRKRGKLSGKQRKTREAQMSEHVLIVVTGAIKTAFIDHPGSGHGTTWDQVTKSDEESIHLAKAVLIALRKAGYSIISVEDDNLQKP
jgi:hypothetical protein